MPDIVILVNTLSGWPTRSESENVTCSDYPYRRDGFSKIPNLGTKLSLRDLR